MICKTVFSLGEVLSSDAAGAFSVLEAALLPAVLEEEPQALVTITIANNKLIILHNFFILIPPI